jgi:hypothetical protein
MQHISAAALIGSPRITLRSALLLSLLVPGCRIIDKARQ